MALIDDDDFDDISRFKWRIAGRGYAIRDVSRKDNPEGIKEYMHRRIISARLGEQVDHINMNKLDNRKRNLRIATASENAAHKGMQSNNTIGFKGVSYRSSERIYIAKSEIMGRHIHIGRFKNPIAAARAYDDFIVKTFGEFAVTNKSLGLL